MLSKQRIGSLIYLGKRCELWLDTEQSKNFIFRNQKFWVSSRIANNSAVINKEFDKFCEIELGKIIDKAIDKLKRKKIKLALDHTDGKTTFKKVVTLAIDDYLKLIGFDKKVEYKIGNYEKEWGINQINIKQKNFVLFFNLNLIKFDSGEHIKYVVAHELAHIFHRDHGKEFNTTLEKLFPAKRSSENFFDFRLPQMFSSKTSSSGNLFLFFVIIILMYGLWLFIGGWLNSTFNSSVAPTF
ncbi:MAG: M48 family metallopeptidase [Patescibacteria group bacterium]